MMKPIAKALSDGIRRWPKESQQRLADELKRLNERKSRNPDSVHMGKPKG